MVEIRMKAIIQIEKSKLNYQIDILHPIRHCPKCQFNVIVLILEGIMSTNSFPLISPIICQHGLSI